MLSAISPPVFTNPVGTARPAAGLEAQLDRYQIQLADWVNCPSCKTAEGKAKIAEISGKISDIQSRIEEAAAAKSVTPAPNAIAPAIIPAAATTPPSPTATVGSRLNVFA